MKTTSLERKLTNRALSTWQRVRSTSELQNLIARREVALATLPISDDF